MLAFHRHVTFPAQGAAAFSGSNYAVAKYQDRSLAKLGPYGGMSLIGGWLALTIL